MRALIDGDILLYRVGFGAEGEEGQIAISRMDESISRILEATNSDTYTIYLSDGRDKTFRYKLNPHYKEQRTQPKPIHYDLLKEYLIETYNAIVAVEEEADDLMGIEQSTNKDTIICSIDKDLLQIPGLHYHFVKNEFIDIQEEEGRLFFYLQLLMGDKADNIPGITGIGIAKATRILDGHLGESDEVLFTIIQKEYRNWLIDFWADQYDEEWTDVQEDYMNKQILLNGQMLKIRTYKGEVWQLPLKNGQRADAEVSLPQSSEGAIDDGHPSTSV